MLQLSNYQTTNKVGNAYFYTLNCNQENYENNDN
jgi:hypothetical protein